MKKSQSQLRLVIFVLVPPILITCLCVWFSIPRVRDFLDSSADPDYLWSIRITEALSDKGYPVHDVTVSESEPPGFRMVDVQVGNLLDGEEQRTYELVKEVHLIIMETFSNESAQPELLNVIDVMVIDYDSGSYHVFVDYETARKFYKGEISEKAYFEKWSYAEKTPEITPP